ncbi:hypothetical protein [Salinicoccus roseus]|jgi:hypothetical protein|uniref:hypothetical protein n=1 Tax=Salinicoccus roseus TaxID=45670 RepID=UPI001EF5F668|nr:hypothetical protein [Salinicoccus roseus]MCG7331933.1 hypothetical protein [Salinicoccus roseus]
MADEKNKRMTTEEDEEMLKRQKERGLEDEVKEDVPPDSPPSQRGKDEAERKEDVQKQKDEKHPLGNEEDK